MQEVWKDIKGFEGRYQVSNLGRVRSLPFMQRYLLRTGVEAFRQTAEKVLSQQPINSGYNIVHLYLGGVRKAMTVHTLVAAAFIEGSGEVVNHIDGNKQNNAASNLAWCSYRENLLHAVATGLHPQAIKVRHPETGTVYDSISQAAKQARVAHRTAARWARV